ncbi:SOS response-associated peptidase family protein [Brucella sp. 2280]|nr:SOS response-associated peptidase family protein [Brucella sp. 2280]
MARRQNRREVQSCTIIVTSANMFMGEIHDRMPVILDEKHWIPWLAEPRQDMLVPANENKLQAWRVSPQVNSSRYQGDDTMAPFSTERVLN